MDNIHPAQQSYRLLSRSWLGLSKPSYVLIPLTGALPHKLIDFSARSETLLRFPFLCALTNTDMLSLWEEHTIYLLEDLVVSTSPNPRLCYISNFPDCSAGLPMFRVHHPRPRVYFHVLGQSLQELR